MGREDHRPPTRSHVENEFLHDLLVHRVEARKGFVQNHEIGVVGDGPEDLDLLAHPLGKGFHLGIREISQTVTFQKLTGSNGRLLPRHPLERCEVGDRSPGLHLLVEPLFFGEVADAVADLQGRGAAEDRDGPGCGFENLKNHAQGGGLAGAVGP